MRTTKVLFSLTCMVMLASAAAPAKVIMDQVYLFGIKGLTPTAGAGWSCALMIAGWMLREWRIERQWSASDRLAKREGYSKQVQSLTDENRALRADLREQEKLHNDYRRLCQEETDQLRDEMRTMRDEFEGWKRKIASYGEAYADLLNDIKGEPL